jgi:hypothetical protein
MTDDPHKLAAEAFQRSKRVFETLPEGLRPGFLMTLLREIERRSEAADHFDATEVNTVVEAAIEAALQSVGMRSAHRDPPPR